MSSAVRMTGITKRFGSVLALDRIDLDVRAHSIHAVVGENGAGKTTLMRALYGASPPDEGAIELNGKPIRLGSSRQAIAAGIGMVSQHYGIIPELTCLENLVLGAEGGPFLERNKMRARAEELAQKMGFKFEWDAAAATLSPAGAQKLEIMKLLWRNARIMILDEPTAMLSPSDSEALFGSLRSLTEGADGDAATVILVTHRIPDVIDHCETVTVLRGGKLISTMPVSSTNAHELATLVVGSAAEAESLTGIRIPDQQSENVRVEAGAPSQVRLKLQNATVRGLRGEDAVISASLELHAGEVVGVAGVDGSGQRELLHAILGLLPLRNGSLTLEGTDVSRRSAADRISMGIRAIPEDRHAEAVIESWSLELNSALGLQRLPPLAVGSLLGSRVDVAARSKWAGRVAERFHTRHGGLSLPMSSLSGGNQQRFVAGRAIESSPSVIVAFQPARGLDLASTRNVYRGIRECCAQGACALIVSFDLDELLEHCDRVVAMYLGRLSEPEAPEARSRDVIGRLMVGAA